MNAKLSPFTSPKPPDVIPLCVPRWDEREVLTLGASYSEEHGFHVEADAYLDPFWNWLPLRWKHPERPALLPEMLPATTWEENLRTKLPSDRWDALRRYAYSAAGYRCEICGQKGHPTLEAHERWSWDDLWCVQKLEGIIALCPPCHKVHHLGLARRLGMYDSVLAKMQEVNGWTATQVQAAIKESATQADERSRFGWTVDLSWLETGPYHLVYRLGGSR